MCKEQTMMLESIEKKLEELTKIEIEFAALKTENAELKTQCAVLKTENTALKERLAERDVLAEVKNDITIVKDVVTAPSAATQPAKKGTAEYTKMKHLQYFIIVLFTMLEVFLIYSCQAAGATVGHVIATSLVSAFTIAVCIFTVKILPEYTVEKINIAYGHVELSKKIFKDICAYAAPILALLGFGIIEIPLL